jgi:hypothetical protein
MFHIGTKLSISTLTVIVVSQKGVFLSNGTWELYTSIVRIIPNGVST